MTTTTTELWTTDTSTPEVLGVHSPLAADVLNIGCEPWHNGFALAGVTVRRASPQKLRRTFPTLEDYVERTYGA